MRVVLLALWFVTSQGLATALANRVQSLVGKKLTSSAAIVAKINEVDENGRNALHHAVMIGNLALVEFFLANGIYTGITDNNDRTPLRYAERLVDQQPSIERMKIISLVLEKTLGLNDVDWGGWSPIVWSLMAGDYDRVIELRDRGAELFADGRRSRGQHAVWAAEYLQDSQAIQIIAEGMLAKYSGGYLADYQERMIDLVANYLQEDNWQDDEFIKILAKRLPDWYYFEAVNKGYSKFAQAMIDRGVNPATSKNRDGVNQVMEVARAGQNKKLQALIDSGVAIDSKILFLAISSGNPEIVETIIKHDIALVGKLVTDLMYGIVIPYKIRVTIGDVLTGTSNDKGKQKIHQMITKIASESTANLPEFTTIAKLQQLNENTGQNIFKDTSLFSIAATNGLDQQLQEILVHADANTRMQWAVHLGDAKLLKKALADGADINHQQTVLGSVVWRLTNSQRRQDFLAIMALLLAHGADPNVAVGRGVFDEDYPIQELIRKKDHEGIKLLLDHGADPNQLALATSYTGDSEIIEMLIAYGADVNSNRGQESTPLKAAARRGRADLVWRYLNLGAELDDHDRHRGSAFTQAARNGHLKIVKILDAHGARTDISCYYGRPIDAARRFEHDSVVEFLKEQSQ